MFYGPKILLTENKIHPTGENQNLVRELKKTLYEYYYRYLKLNIKIHFGRTSSDPTTDKLLI